MIVNRNAPPHRTAGPAAPMPEAAAGLPGPVRTAGELRLPRIGFRINGDNGGDGPKLAANGKSNLCARSTDTAQHAGTLARGIGDANNARRSDMSGADRADIDFDWGTDARAFETRPGIGPLAKRLPSLGATGRLTGDVRHFKSVLSRVRRRVGGE